MSLLPKHGLMNMYIFLKVSSPHSFIKNPQFDVDIIPPPPLPCKISSFFVFLCWQAEDRLPTTSLSIPTYATRQCAATFFSSRQHEVSVHSEYFQISSKFVGLKACNNNVNPFPSLF